MLTLNPDPVLQRLVERVDSLSILASLNRLEAFRTRHSSTDSLVAAREWLVTKFQEYGYSDILLHPFTWSGRTLHNIVVTKPGTRFPDTFVLLIGHYDSISEIPATLAPGVNDNGSGIALILELARILATHQLDYSVRFICFSAEEQGLVGSRAYVNNVVAPQNHDIRLVINVDEIGGYRGNVNTMVKVERDESNNPSGNNAASAAYTDTLAALTRTYSTLTTTITNAYGSDYMSFEARGYVITGYYEGQTTPHYHRSTDNVANVDPPYLYQITRGALAGMAYFGGVHRRYLFIHHTPQSNTQDTSRSVQLDAGVQASAQIVSASIRYRIHPDPSYAESTMAQASVHGDTTRYRGWIPKQPYGTVVEYFLRFESADTVISTFPPDTLSPLLFSFMPDTVPPAITHEPLNSLSYLDAPFEIRAGLGDENGIAGAWIVYRINEGPDTTAALQQLTTQVWRGYLAGDFLPADRLEYRIVAHDASFSSNLASVPASGRYSFRILNSIVYDFETTGGNFAPSADWQWGTIATPEIPAPPAGVKVWGTNLAGNYSNNTSSALTSPAIDLADKTGIVLTFRHFHSIEPQNDGGNVSVSPNNGAFQIVSPAGGYPAASIAALGGPGYSGNSFTWKTARFDLQAFQNDSVRIRFLFASDLLTSHRGWYVDDVRIDYLDSITTGALASGNTLPTEIRLFQNYPNPFNPTTTLSFEIPRASFVVLKVCDVLGRDIGTLVNGELNAGRYEVVYDARTLASGTYFYQLVAGGQILTKKLVLLR